MHIAAAFDKKFGISRGVLALSVARMADGLGNSILIVIIPLYVADLPHVYISFPLPVLVGILISVYGLISAAAQPFGGALADRLGRRKILIQAGLGIMCVGTLAFMLAGRFVDLLALRIIQGLAVALTIPASMSLMTAITKRETRGASMGFYSMLRLIGFSTGPILGGFLKVHFGFDAAFVVGSAFVLLAMVLIQSWVRDVKLSDEQRTAPRAALRVFDRNLMTPGILSAAVSTFLMANAFSMVTTLENEFNARLSMNAFGFGIAFSMVMIGRLLFQVPLGRLSDIIGRKPLVIGGLLLMAPVTALLGATTTSTQLILLRFAQGLAGAGIAAPAMAVAGDLSTQGGEGRQMSIVTTGFGLGIAVGPLLAGLLSVISFDLPFIVGGLMSLGGIWIVYRWMPETVDGERALFKQHRQQA